MRVLPERYPISVGSEALAHKRAQVAGRQKAALPVPLCNAFRHMAQYRFATRFGL